MTDSLRQAELLETTLSHIADFVYIFDREGRFLYVNKALLDLWGLKLEDAVGRDFFDLQYPEDLARRLQDQIEEVFTSGREVRDETEYVSPAGDRQHYEYIFSPVFADDGTVLQVVGSTRKITERRVAESALAENEKRHREVLESIKDHAIFTLDSSGNITTWNAGAERIFGYAEEEIIGRQGGILWTPEDQALEIDLQEMETAARTGRADDERWHMRRDGSRFFATGSLHAIRDGGEAVTGFTKICRDVTEERRTSNELFKVRRRLEAALLAGEIGTWVLELDTNKVYADRNLAALFRVSPEDAEGGALDVYLQAIHPDDKERVKASIAQSLADGTNFEADYRIAADTGWRWVAARGRFERDAEGRSIRMPGVVLDITSRKKVEEDLREVQERFGLTITAAELGTFHCPMPMGEIVWNDKCKEHFWLPPDAKIDFDLFFKLIHPEDRERVREAVNRAVFDRAGYDIEYRTVSSTGEVRWIHAIGRCFYGDDGQPERFDGISVDVNERRQLDERREEYLRSERAARAEMERTNHIKDEFLATLSHELRTPLNAILGWTQVLRGSPHDEEGIRQGLAVIERNARAQTQIIEDLLDMSRIISGKVRLDVQRLDVAAILDGAVETTRPAAAAKGVTLVVDLDRAATSISGDPNRLQQVFWNLLSNAVKFTPKDGSVTVRMESTRTHVQVMVEDTGEGIPPEFLPHVFDRFRQSDASSTRRHGGLGLGLSIVKQLVELHGGSVRASSEGKGKGASFSVRLPLVNTLAAAPSERTQRRAETGEEPPVTESAVLNIDLSEATILVVDDEPEARGLVKRLLEDRGARVLSAESVNEAVAVFLREKVDLVISDIGMPDRDGFDLIRSIRDLGMERGGAVPAIALTAYARGEDRKKAVMAGFQLHLTKPIEARELLTMSANLLGRMPNQRT